MDFLTLVSSEPLASFLPLSTLEGSGGIKPTVGGAFLSREDLFIHIQDLLDEPMASNGRQNRTAGGPVAVIKLSSRLAISFNKDRVRPSHVQCFLKAILTRYGRAPSSRPNSRLAPIIVDQNSELTIWSTASIAADELVRTWQQISTGGAVSELEALTTPKLYGSKERLTNFLHAVSVAALPQGIPILDMMSGTGIVSRTLAARHSVFANDANPYAALLTRVQGIGASPDDVASMVQKILPLFSANQKKAEPLVHDALAKESAFLHGELNERVLAEYVQFCNEPVLKVSDGPGEKLGPQTLVTERYSNAYFGIAQSIEIDSLRAAIEVVFPDEEPWRHLVLAALLVAVCLCNSGPHFAQPPKILNRKALGGIIERRARSVLWEFELALNRLAARPRLTLPLERVTNLNWSEAFDHFLEAVPKGPRAVYLDPPYSKLQYSRYYHVLNVLLAYDYPPIHGVGRYPPLTQRFSSRFEFQPGAAEREIEQILSRCAKSKTAIMLSYYDRGFLKVPFLMDAMTRHFGRVDIFYESLRHHSQGVKLNEVGKVNEYVFVGGI